MLREKTRVVPWGKADHVLLFLSERSGMGTLFPHEPGAVPGKENSAGDCVMEICVGIIGGSGLEDPHFFIPEREWRPQSPWGETSGPLVQGSLEGVPVILLSRHGPQHQIPPGQVNNRANISALKAAGCTHLLATAACGSLRAGIGRGQLVVPDQIIDFTRQRPVSFEDQAEQGDRARRMSPACPFSPFLRSSLLQAARHIGVSARDGAVLLSIEGPRFSTRSESRMFRTWGADLVNMTVAPEAALAGEAGLPYAVLAMVTDFDSWNDEEAPLRVADLLEVFRRNVNHMTLLLRATLPIIAKREEL